MACLVLVYALILKDVKVIKGINFNNLNSQLEIRCRKGPKYTLLKMHRQVKESPVTLEYL